MIVRLVRMSFQTDQIETFRSLFIERRNLIRNFPGCLHLELWQDNYQKNVFFTYSIWNSEADLNTYRHSDIFQDTWAKTKILFSEKPEARTLSSDFPFVPSAD